MMVTRHFLRLHRVTLIVWLMISVLMTFLVANLSPAATNTGAIQEVFRAFPPGLQHMLGGDLARYPHPVDSYISIKLLMFLPVLLGVYAALSAAAIIAREQTRGTLDFLLALPLNRAQILRQRFAAVAIGLVVLYGGVWVTLVVGLQSVGMTGSSGGYALVLLAGLAINVAQSALTLAISLLVRDHAQATRYGLGVVLVPYIFWLALQGADLLPWLRNLLLYGFVSPADALIDGRFPWPALLAGGIVTTASLIWAQALFARKQLHG